MRPQTGSLACLPGGGTEVRLMPSAKPTCNYAQEHKPCTKVLSMWKGSIFWGCWATADRKARKLQDREAKQSRKGGREKHKGWILFCLASFLFFIFALQTKPRASCLCGSAREMRCSLPSRSACLYKNLMAGEGRELLFIKYTLTYKE